ncbi:MAG: hypothetical protein AB7N76_31775 [Planctomycetota bacterium]
MKLRDEDFKKLENHYTGNCFGCERCDFYGRLTREPPDPKAAEEYAAYMREQRGEELRLLPSD